MISPTVIQPCVNDAWVYALGFSPLCNTHAFFSYSDDSVCSYVVRLLFVCAPTTVFLCISKATVNSIKRHSFWSCAHIFSEGLKRLPPCIANRDAFPSIVGKALTAVCITPCHHVFPRLALSVHVTPAVRVLFRFCSIAFLFIDQTSARFNRAAFYIRPSCNLCSTAHTDKVPEFQSIFACFTSWANRCKFPKSHARNVFDSVHYCIVPRSA